MGTLADITARANNVKGRQRASPQPATLMSQQNENVAKVKVLTSKPNKSPGFMAPTMASTSQAATPLAKAGARASSPTSLASGSTKGRNWMASAVKRVGMRRSGDRIADAKKGVSPSNANALRVSEKVPSHRSFPGRCLYC